MVNIILFVNLIFFFRQKYEPHNFPSKGDIKNFLKIIKITIIMHTIQRTNFRPNPRKGYIHSTRNINVNQKQK